MTQESQIDKASIDDFAADVTQVSDGTAPVHARNAVAEDTVAHVECRAIGNVLRVVFHALEQRLHGIRRELRHGGASTEHEGIDPPGRAPELEILFFERPQLLKKVYGKSVTALITELGESEPSPRPTEART